METRTDPRKSSSSLSPSKLREDAFFSGSRGKLELSSVPNGEAISALYGQLNSCISDLDQKVENVLKKHEVDFLSVYRGHMFSIQKEMRQLKERASEEENKRRRDEEIRKLTQERDWFRNEAVRLDKLCKDYKQTVSFWKAKVAALEEDRQFLQSQVLSAQKSNVRSQEELEKKEASTEEISPIEKAPESDGSLSIASAKKPVFVTHASSPDLQDVADFGETEQRYKGTIQHLKHQIQVQKGALRRVKSVKTSYLLERGELEDFFMGCIDEVKKDILARRYRGAQLLSRSPSKVMDVNSSQRMKGTVPETTEEVTLAMFTEGDKRKVMEKLLSNDAVLLYLHRSLFPEKRSQSVTRMQDPPSRRQGASREVPFHLSSSSQYGARLTPGKPTHPRHSLFRS